MDPLPSSISQALSAVQGWMELGTAEEALQELRGIAAPWDEHPAVLEVMWAVQAKLKKWDTCVALAERLIAAVPDHEGGWIHRSYALHELHRTQEALEKLSECVAQFPKSTTIPYNLACYQAQLGKIDAARAWLIKAFSRSDDAKGLKEQALRDPDLAPLHSEIRTMPQ